MESTTKKFETCEVCAKAEAKYTCPKCEVRTCGLACVNIHKKELECDGIRDGTKFIPLNSFTDLDLLSDYRLLENFGRSVEQLRNDPLKRYTRENNVLPVHLIKLKRAARDRRIQLEFMPQHFSRHKENTTYYKWKENELSWKVDFIFPQAENIKWTVERALETKRLSEFLEEIFYTHCEEKSDNDLSLRLLALQKKLKFYRSCGLSGVKLLLKAEKIEKSNSRFYEVDITQSIKENLKNRTIVEYPVIYVVPKDHSHIYEIVDSDEELEANEQVTDNDNVTQKRKNIKNFKNNFVKKKSKKKKTDSSVNYFFNADTSDSEDDDRVSSSYAKDQNFESHDPNNQSMAKADL